MIYSKTETVNPEFMKAHYIASFINDSVWGIEDSAKKDGELVDWGSLDFSIDRESIEERTYSGFAVVSTPTYFVLNITVNSVGEEDEDD